MPFLAGLQSNSGPWIGDVRLSVCPSINILVKVSGWGKISAMNRDTGLILGM